MIDKAKHLLTLANEDPEFIYNVRNIMDGLNRIVGTESNQSKVSEAQSLVIALMAKQTGEELLPVSKAFKEFINGSIRKLNNRFILEEVSLETILKAKEVSLNFMKIADSTISKGMHDKANKFFITYMNQLARKFISQYETGDSHRWTTYGELKTLIYTGYPKNLIKAKDVDTVLPIFKICLNEIYDYETKVPELRKLSAFNDKSVVIDFSKFDVASYIRTLQLKFLYSFDSYTEYFRENSQMLDRMYANNELSNEEYSYFHNKVVGAYNPVVNRKYKYDIEPLIVCYRLTELKKDMSALLRFDYEEMMNAYSIASKYNKVFTSSNIEAIFVRNMDLLMSRLSTENKGLQDAGLKTLEDYLKVLIKYKIISPSKADYYSEKYK